MSGARALTAIVLTWAVVGASVAHADPVTSTSGSWLWMHFWPASATSAASTSVATTNTAADDGPVAAFSPSVSVNSPLLAVPAAAAPVAPIISAPAPAPVAAPAPAPVAAPAPAPAISVPAPSVLSAPAALSMAPPMVQSAGASSGATFNAAINMGAGPYPEAGTLTTGGAQPWYDSSAAVKAFGGVPNAQQQTAFTQSVLQDVQHTFQISGMSPTITTDPNAPAQHTISVVSGTSYGANPNAIGITDVGHNGFGFIDKLAYASNPTDLAWAVAHNVSHELMHAFGIGYHPDGGNYVDAGTANWSSLIDPNEQFGPSATQLLLASQYGILNSTGLGAGLGAEQLNPDGTQLDGDETIAQPVPEPAAVLAWALGACVGAGMLRRRSRRAAA